MYERIVFNLSSPARRETLDGREHFVVPAAILAEGVWAGSAGPIYYPEEELRKSALAWNHKPIVVYHPERDGVPVSACDPVILNNRKIGVVLNTKHDDKLRTECWFDIERVKTVDSRIYSALQDSKPVEVSTGLDMDGIQGDGKWKEKDYKITGRNYRPDHLAVLPDKIGAYSVKDGAGLFANTATEPERVQRVLSRTVSQLLQVVKAEIKSENELSFSDISRQLSDLLASKFGEPGKYWDGYICEVYPDKVVFRNGYSSGDKLWMIGYSVKSEAVSLIGEAEEVQRVVEYKSLNHSRSYFPEGGSLVFKTKETPVAFDKKTHVNALIANGVWQEADRPWLDSLPDEKLERMKVPVSTPTVNTTPIETFTVPPPTPPVTMLSTEQYIANAPPAIREVLADSMAAANAERGRLVEEILKAPGNVFTKEQLSATPITNLRGIYSLIPKPQMGIDQLNPLVGPGAQSIPNYLGAAGAAPIANAALPTDFLALPDINYAAK